MIQWLAAGIRSNIEWLAGRTMAAVEWLATKTAQQTEWLAGKITASVEWLAGKIAVQTEWLAGRIAAQFEWLAVRIAAQFTWLAEKIAAQFFWLRGEIALLLLSSTNAIVDAVVEVRTAVEALPEKIAAGMQSAVEKALEVSFKPTPAKLDQFGGLKTLLLSKPPFSFIPPASLFNWTGGGSSCQLPSIGPVSLAGMSVGIEWPEFVCTLAGYVRSFMTGLMYVGTAWFVMFKVWPQVQI